MTRRLPAINGFSLLFYLQTKHINGTVCSRVLQHYKEILLVSRQTEYTLTDKVPILFGFIYYVHLYVFFGRAP